MRRQARIHRIDRVQVMVVGSFAVGMTVRIPRLPVLGETLMGDDFNLGPGGKGSNMAIAVSRLGITAGIIATVGDDSFGDMAFDRLALEGVDTQGLRRVSGWKTAVGLVYLLPTGQNVIGSYAGAFVCLGAQDVRGAADRIRSADVLIVELGAMDDAIEEAIHVAAESETQVILNPAPARPIAAELLRHVDYFTPNETEARILLGLSPDDTSVPAGQLARGLRDLGPRTVIVTRGERGCAIDGPDGKYELPSFPVRSLDTVGAGDAFSGGLAAALVRGTVGIDAYRWASATAALSTTAIGAVEGLPNSSHVEAALEDWGREGRADGSK